jgi:hypothetical protein
MTENNAIHGRGTGIPYVPADIMSLSMMRISRCLSKNLRNLSIV